MEDLKLYARGERHHSAKLTKDQVIEIRRRYATKLTTMVSLAEEFKVSYISISAIIHRKTWRHLKEER